MKFVCFEYMSIERYMELSPEERAALEEASIAYDKRLDGDGVLVDAVLLGTERLLVPPDSRGGENIVGYLVVEAEGPEEARRIAEGIPMVRFGRVEVREVQASYS